MKFTKEELVVIDYALKFAIDNGLADEYEDTELLFSLYDRLIERDFDEQT